jgi:exopolyphosphatase/guanosine-5'-triphosphate,3'-diphosphate pyrophosphatase
VAKRSKPTSRKPSVAAVAAIDAPEDAPGRLNGKGALAVIDIGSNSVRLVVYERLCRAPSALFNEKALCGLGRGMTKTGKLDPAAVATALAAIRRFRALIDQMRVPTTHVLATSAPREASDGKDFLAKVSEIAGAKVQLLSGPGEARLGALGVVSGILDADGVSGDLGGGSLEVAEVNNHRVQGGETFPIGSLRLEEAAGKSVKEAEKIAAGLLKDSKILHRERGKQFYAIGGTWRSLARLHMHQMGYPLHIMHHYTIEADAALDFCRLVARHDIDSLDSIDAVSRSRRPLLPYGAAVLGEVIRAMKPEKVVFSALGVREGHLYDLLSPAEKKEDPLISACQELAYLRSRSPRHAQELGGWSGGVLEALGLDETPAEARLRQAACLLTDIGWRAHPDYRGDQSLNLIAYGNFIGIDHPGRAYLALAAYYRYQGLGNEQTISARIREIATPRMIERARALGAALRVAYLVSGAMPGVIGRTRMAVKGRELALLLPPSLEALAGERLLRRLGQLAKLAGKEPAIVIER